MQKHIIRNGRYLFLYIFVTLCIAGGRAQQLPLDDFSYLRSYGPVPKDFLNSAGMVTMDYSTKKNATHPHHRLKGREKFEVVTDYGLNEMFLSGRVVYGDAIGNFVNKVADSLLAPYPEIRKQMRFYVTKSVVANAYSTDKGVVFINVGLIARLKNEAQLAYVIAHEVVHFVRQNNITIFLEKEKMESNKRKDNSYRDLSLTDRLLAINFRSKEIETNADLEGLRTYYARSPYDIDAVEGVLDVLLYSAYPFTDEPFDLSLLETKDMVIPDHFLVDEIDAIKVNEDEADSMSTHPNVKIRKQKLRELIDSIPESGTKLFLQPEKDFSYIKTMAQFEVIRQLIVGHRLAEALFCTSAMLDEFPDNRYLKKCFAAELYGISAYKTHGDAGEVFENYRDVKGETRQVNYLISKLSRRDLNIIALNYVYRRHAENPGDKYLTEITKELFHDLVFESEAKESFFYNKSLAQLRAEQKVPEPEDTNANDNKKRKKKHTRESKIDTTFTKFAFVDLFADSSFKDEFTLYYNKRDSADKADDIRNNTFSPFPVAKKTVKIKKKDRKYINHFLMADPYTVKVDYRKRDKLQYQESELNLSRIKELMEKNAGIAKVDMDMVDAKGFGENSTPEFNDMAGVNEYIEERFNQTTDGILISFCKENIDTLMQRSNTHYLGWSAVVSIQKKKPILVLSLLSILPYMWPFTIYEFVTPKIHTYFYHVLFDVNSGKLKIAKSSKIRSDLRNDQLNAHIYDFMYTIKKTYE